MMPRLSTDHKDRPAKAEAARQRAAERRAEIRGREDEAIAQHNREHGPWTDLPKPPTPPEPRPRKAAASTIETIVFTLRERGVDGLREAATQSRITECSPEQLAAIVKRLVKVRARYPVITDELLAALRGV